ncbi:MAG: site-2 protease family protein [Candidatus Zixiibacteriota bacterium]
MKREALQEQVGQIRALLDDLIVLEAVYTSRASVTFRGMPRVPVGDFESTVRARLEAAGFDGTVEASPELGAGSIRALVTVQLEKQTARFPWVNVLLFAATVISTTWLGGASFAAWFMAILICHEFGHFTLARRRRIDASWPYFIPAPNILGTFGAFIQLRSPIRDRTALFDMAIAGPLAGFVVAVTALFVGLAKSTIVAAGAEGTQIILGDSLLFRGVAALVLPTMTPDQDVMLHPIAFAGWAGLLVTMFNLFPMGQLDGGHIAYAILKRGQRWLALAAIAGLVAISLWWPWWLVWVAIGLFLRPEHPPTLVDEIAVGRTRRILGAVAFVIFILCFTPVPFRIP